MSALDQAFIKAFAKEPATAPARRQPPAEYAPVAPPAPTGEPHAFDELYDAGTFYRVDAGKAEQAVPASHLQPERKVPRRLQRRSASRQELQVPEPPPSEPIAESPPLPLPPRRNWSRSMLDIARQLARLDLMNLASSGELPPEIVFIEPLAPEAPTPPVPAPVAPAPTAVPEQNVAATSSGNVELELPPSAPQAFANLWTVDAPIVAQSSVMHLNDAETWLALPMAPAVACHENVADGWYGLARPSADAPNAEPPSVGSSQEGTTGSALAVEGDSVHVVSAEESRQAKDELAARAARELKEKKAKRRLRIDGSHKPLPAPHVAAPPVIRKPIEAAAAEEIIVEAIEDSPGIVAVATAVAETVAPEAVAPEAIAISRPIVETPTPLVPAPVVEQPAVEPPVTENVVAEKPVAEKLVAEKLVAEAPVTIPKRPYVPLWEVDRFTWPALCDKLMHDPNGYFASASNKLLNVVRGGLKVLGITGSRRGEGRTTLALCLARAAAQAGIHVALVDADFSRPQLATMLGLETAYGWQEAATGKIPLSEAAVKSLADRLTVLPLEVTASTAPLSLADPRVTATLRATAATFDLVIVDLGPLGSATEPLFPAGENCPLDAAVVVRDTRFASVGESRTVGDRLYEAGIEAVGIAENFVTQQELSFL